MKIKKYLYAFAGAIYGAVLASISTPILFPIQEIREAIPIIRRHPLLLLNPLILLAILLMILGGFIVGIALIPFVAFETAIAFYNREWKAGLSPFQIILAYTLKRSDSQPIDIKTLVNLNRDEQHEALEADIAAHVIKTNMLIKQSIDSLLRRDVTSEHKEFPLEISAIITAYTIEACKKTFSFDMYKIEHGIEENEALLVAEKFLRSNIKPVHALTPSPSKSGLFSCLKKCIKKAKPKHTNDESLEYITIAKLR